MTTNTMTTTTPRNARHTYPGACGGFNQWVRILAQELTNTTPPPRDAILTHHGLTFFWRGLRLSLAPWNEGGNTPAGTMVVILERALTRCEWKAAHGRPRIVGFKARTWKRLRAAVALAFGGTIRTTWNGGDGCTSASLTMATPGNLRWIEAAVANYRNTPDVFRMTAAEVARTKTMADWQAGIASIMNVPNRRERPDYHLITAAEIVVPEGGRRIWMKGDLFTPADFPAAERREAFEAAKRRIHATGQAYFPDATTMQVTLHPNPIQ